MVLDEQRVTQFMNDLTATVADCDRQIWGWRGRRRQCPTSRSSHLSATRSTGSHRKTRGALGPPWLHRCRPSMNAPGLLATQHVRLLAAVGVGLRFGGHTLATQRTDHLHLRELLDLRPPSRHSWAIAAILDVLAWPGWSTMLRTSGLPPLVSSSTTTRTETSLLASK